MSSMLEQAIVDASALREAALKNAESAIIEKYAPEIKSAVEALLEQPEAEDEEALGLGGDEDPAAELGAELGAEGEAEPEEVDVPPAFTEGEPLCPCPEQDEDVEVELSFDDLKQMASQLAPEEGEQEGHEELAAGLPELGEEEPLAESVEEDDEIVLDEEAIAALVEELVVDITPQKSGWAGTPETTMLHYEELALAHRAATEVKAENDELRKAVSELNESKKRLKNTNKVLKETVLKLKSAFDDMSTSNAKLLYTNRILSSPSLNERQKENIVEAISKAGSVDEAKVIYETLQSTGGTARRKQVPQSLSEAIKRSSSTVLPRRQPERTTDTAIDRLQILAGIKHNK